MPKASDVKRGEIIRHKGRVFSVSKIEIRTPSSRGSNTLYKMKLRDVQSRQNYDETFKGEDQLEDVDFVRRQASYSYFDGEMYVFMDDEDYSQYSFNEADLEGQLEFLSEGLGGIFVTVIDGAAAGIQLPPSVNLEIVETAPMLKGGTATKRSKPAKLAGGLEVLVPEFIESGEVIKVNTETGEYMSRA
jgi:elongation factor P